jgi:glycerophosphoryl diester phosphodiesterase
MLAFRNAVQWKGKNGELQPTKVIEFDVQKSKDNVLVSEELSEKLSK